jgi:ribonuclease BN (tRNA processing enzyme)
MRITVLGCNGSITADLRTTCYLVDDDVLIDVGSGAGDLSLQQAIRIDTVFLTHSHLDHCCLLPMLADAAGNFRNVPLNVYALPETIRILMSNMFNNQLWPDYTKRPTPEHPYLRFMPIRLGSTIDLKGRRFTAMPAQHAVPCIGYHVDSGMSSWVYSGDTTLCEEFWLAVRRITNLHYLLIETTFLNSNGKSAQFSGHMTPNLLASGLDMLTKPVELFIVHMEAGREKDTMQEIVASVGSFKPTELRRGHVFEL